MPRLVVALLVAFVLTGSVLACSSIQAAVPKEEHRKDELTGRDYYVYTPQNLDKSKTYWLVVGVHYYGGNGKGAAGLASWADKHDCIVLGPSFPNDGYQGLEKRSDKQLIGIVEELKKELSLNPKLFIYGFSGGAQYAHRFTMRYPEMVAGCSAHSGGSWATGDGWQSVNSEAVNVPIVMSCGEKDTAKSFGEAPFNRLQWAKEFERQLKEDNFLYEARYFPGVAHRLTPPVMQMTEACFELATNMVPAVEGQFAQMSELAADGRFAEAAALAKQVKQLKSPVKSEIIARYLTRVRDAAEKLEADYLQRDK